MATDVERLVISLEANMKSASRESAKARKAMDQALKQMENRVRASEDRIGRSFEGLGDRLKTGLQGVGIGAAVAIVKQLADQWTEAGNKIAAAGVPIDQQGQKLEQLSVIAERSRSAFAETADLYARMARSSEALGASQAELAVATETVAKALKLGGASAQEMASTLTQLGQALGSGRLNGDELRSLGENAPVVMRAIAKEFGVAAAELKELGEQGKLTSDKVFRALVNAAPDVEDAFSKTKATISDAFTTLETAAARYIGQSAAVSTATGTVSSAMQLLANNIAVVGDGAAILGTVIAARLIGQGLTPAVAALGLQATAAARAATGMNALNVALVATTARLHATALASRAASAALALVGGPVGAAILGVAAATVYFSSESAKAAERSRQYAAALDEVRSKADGAGKAIDAKTNAIIRAAKREAEAQQKDLSARLAATEDDVRSFAAQIDVAMTQAANAMRSRGLNANAGKELDALRDKFKSGEISAEELADKLEELAGSNPRFSDLAGRLTPLLDTLAGAIARVATLRRDLSNLGGAVAAATNKAIEAAIPTPSTTYEQASGTALNDPIIRQLQGQAALRKATAEATMEETAKKIRDTRQKLFDEITKGGGTVDPKALDLAAQRIVAAEEARKGGKSDSERAAEQVKQYTASLQEERAELEAEAAALGQSNLQREIAVNLARAGSAATEAQRQAIIAETTAIYNAKTAIEQYEKAQEEANRTAEYFGDVAIDAITDLALEGRTLEEVFQNVAKSIARAALEAAILGKGPLAGLFGTGGTDGGLGGIVGSIMKAFMPGKAAGGMVNAGQPYTVGESGRELFVPTTPGRIVPNGKFGGGSMQVVIKQEPGVKITQEQSGPKGATLRAQVDDMVSDALLNGGKTAAALKHLRRNQMGR